MIQSLSLEVPVSSTLLYLSLFAVKCFILIMLTFYVIDSNSGTGGSFVFDAALVMCFI